MSEVASGCRGPSGGFVDRGGKFTLVTNHWPRVADERNCVALTGTSEGQTWDFLWPKVSLVPHIWRIATGRRLRLKKLNLAKVNQGKSAFLSGARDGAFPTGAIRQKKRPGIRVKIVSCQG